MTSRRAVRPTGSVMAILRPRAAITSITNWYAAWPKTTVPLWAPIFGDNKHRVVLKRWQSVGVLALLILCAGFAALAPAAVAQSTNKASSANSKKSKKRPTKAGTTKRRRRSSPRLRRMHQAFVASSTLKAMARQLLQDRTPAAYRGVEAYARHHTKEDAGALAWLVLGYAHWLDHDQAKAIDAFNRAKPQAGDLGDYVDYYLGASYFQSGRIAEAISTLNNFDQKYPDSLLIRDARVLYANALLSEARAAAGQTEKAGTTLANLYVTMPLSSEADQAEIELRKLPADIQAKALGVNGRRTRADLLMKGRRFSDAAAAYRDLLNQVDSSDRPAIQLAMAEALRRSGDNKEAKKALESLPSSTPEINGQRLFNLGEVARATDDDDGFLRILGQLRETAPTSPWLEQALLSAGNIYLLRRDYDKAIDSYRELQQRFPDAGRAAYAHWKVAWLTLRQGRNADAKAAFEQQIALYPNSAELPPALYWRARLAEEDNDPVMARAYYQKLFERFRNYYYGELARQRLQQLKNAENAGGDDPPHYALLDRVPPISGPKVEEDETPSDNLRVQKAQLLENGALLEFAVRELQAAGNEEKGSWVPAEMARVYEDAGRYDAAVEVMKHAVPNYFAVDLPTLPRSYWEALFPKPYWPDVKKFSSQNALDPYLVTSLIRQESEFNPNALSRKDAVGLMQLLPKVGKGVAKQQKIKHFSTQQLFTPGVNLQLGTRYFRIMVDKFGAFEYALAAYNAGSDRVQDWLGQAKYRDPQEFVESIPFTETREYVQAILRNANVYRQLYGTP